MQKIEKLLQKRAAELLAEGTVERVLAWQAGEFFYDNAPAAVSSADECDKLVYNEFCPANLCKYLIETSHAGKRTAVFLKPCDTYGVNQLLKDNRIKRELVYAVGTPCGGMLDIKKLKAAGAKGIISVTVDGDEVVVSTAYGEKRLAKADVLLNKCVMCKGAAYKIADEELGEPLAVPQFSSDKFAKVKEIEAMSAEERFAFWQSELSKCIRCNACLSAQGSSSVPIFCKAAYKSGSLSFAILYMLRPPFYCTVRLWVILLEADLRRRRFAVRASLILTEEAVDILHKLHVQQLQMDSLRTNARTFTAASAAPRAAVRRMYSFRR